MLRKEIVMLKFAVLSQYSAQSEWSYERYSPSICDAHCLDKSHISVLRYRR